MVRILLGFFFLSRRTMARRLIAHANVARDSQRFGAAAALYQEALGLGWNDPRIRIQCGNMLKDTGQLKEAEQQYLRAARSLPNDADLPLQLGHLYKLMGDLPRAEEHYRRALALKPGWSAPETELATIAAVDLDPGDDAAADQTGYAAFGAGPIRALLPGGPAPAADRDPFRLFLFGRHSTSYPAPTKVLRGVEAVRGYYISSTELGEISLLVDGECVRREPLVPLRQGGGPGGHKHVFNLWHDFSDAPQGLRLVELCIADPAGKIVHRHRERIAILPPLDEQEAGSSDAWVPPPYTGNTGLTEAINTSPSMVRTTERVLLPNPVRSILVQRVDQLGDLACSVPAIHRLRALFPDAKLVGLVTPANAGLAHALSLFDELVTVDFAEHPAIGRRILSAEAQERLRQSLAPYDFDVAIDLGEGDDSRPLLLLSGARFRYGFRHRHFRFLHAGLDFGGHDPVNGNDVLPPSRKFALLVEGLGALRAEPPQPVPGHDRRLLAGLAIAPDRRYALIHTGARLFFSRWPYFDALARRLLDQTGLDLVILGEKDSFAEAIPDDQRARVHVVPGLLPFPQLDALISNCATFIGNDSGPKHLAALRGVPMVSVHIPRNNWSEWGQEGPGLIVTRRVPCAGCGIPPDGEDCGKAYACIRHVTVDEVFAAATRVLKGAN